MRGMSYPPPSPQYDAPVPPVPQPKRSNTGTIVGVIVGIVLLACLGCGGAIAYFAWWANDKANEIIDNIPTEFPTDYSTAAPGS